MLKWRVRPAALASAVVLITLALASGFLEIFDQPVHFSW